jgi:hypothetical protein
MKGVQERLFNGDECFSIDWNTQSFESRSEPFDVIGGGDRPCSVGESIIRNRWDLVRIEESELMISGKKYERASNRSIFVEADNRLIHSGRDP